MGFSMSILIWVVVVGILVAVFEPEDWIDDDHDMNK